MRMKPLSTNLVQSLDVLGELAHLAAEALAETLWPTRCAVCDAPGAVLCTRCERDLPYINQLTACPRCGAPWGRLQCTECNPVSLAHLERASLPFAACVSAALFESATGRVVRTCKDAGEQRLAGYMARIMARCVPPAWEVDEVAYIPASQEALARRGFDHGFELARACAARLELPCTHALARPRARDQRGLTRAKRIANVRNRFAANPDITPIAGKRLLLVDDVYTTGATLCDASDALLAAGAREVRCLTFARVM